MHIANKAVVDKSPFLCYIIVVALCYNNGRSEVRPMNSAESAHHLNSVSILNVGLTCNPKQAH